jgi:hypothetical protein
MRHVDLNIKDQFVFGKYSGQTLEQVWTGLHSFDSSEVIKEYIYEFFDFFENHDSSTLPIPIMEYDHDSISKEGENEIPPSCCMISERYIVIESNSKKQRQNWRDDLFVFMSGNFHLMKYSAMYPKDYEGSTDVWRDFSEKSKQFIALQADPKYIEWCIKEIDDFYLNPEELDKLNQMKSRYLMNFNVEKVNEDIIKYEPVFEFLQHKTSRKILRVNAEKAGLKI